MALNDIFKSLTRGARFDRGKVAHESTIFAPKCPSPATAATECSVATSSPAPVAVEVTVQKPVKRALHRRMISEVGGRDLRRKEDIRVEGVDVPVPIPYIEQLSNVYKLPKYITQTLLSRGYEKPTPIQMQAWSVLLKQRDLIACGPTGSGKTLAFLVPLLALLDKHSGEGLRALVLSPTKELSQQTQREANRFLDHAPEEGRLQLLRLSSSSARDPKRLNGCDVLISTPQRLLEMVREKGLDLKQVEYVVLDEADTLFAKNFQPQLDEIFAAATKPGLKKSVFSATITPEVQKLATSVMHNSITVKIGKKITANMNVEQRLVFCSTEDSKVLTVRQLFVTGLPLPALVFLQSKERADALYGELRALNVGVGVIHAARTQDQREEAIRMFRLGKLACLICTELLARGIDFKGVGTVINFDIPTSSVKYIHRIGRTGRAGKRGTALTIFTPEDAHYLRVLAPVIHQAGGKVEPWMLAMRRERNPKKRLKRRAAAYQRPAFLQEEGRDQWEEEQQRRRARLARLREKKARREARFAEQAQAKAEKKAAHAEPSAPPPTDTSGPKRKRERAEGSTSQPAKRKRKADP
eukprot:EG_transcript_6971